MVGTAVVVIGLAMAALATQVGWGTAVRGVIGPWAWVADRRVAGLAFYRQGMGVDDIGGNLGRMGVAVLLTGVPVGAAWLVGRRHAAGVIVAAVGWVALAVGWPWAFELPRAWPVLVVGVGGWSAWRPWRGDGGPWATRAMLAGLAVVLLAKMVLAARVSQYGFVLAMPAAVVLTEAAVRWPGRRARAVAIAYLALFVAIHVAVTVGFARAKTVVEGTGRDQFWADRRGAEVMAAVAAVRDVATVATVPQGLMVNYLARRVDPLTAVNLMPPEVASVGEAAVLAGLRRRPPGAVVWVGKDTADGGFLLTEGHHVYGRAIAAWIGANFRVAERVPGELGIVILRRR